MRTAALVVALAAVAIAAPPGLAASRVVGIPGSFYSPRLVTAVDGDTIRWKNSSFQTHTVTSDTAGLFDATLVNGATFTSAPLATTSFRRVLYHCSIHTFMRGEIDVYSLYLTRPTAPVLAGRYVRLTGLAPGEVTSVTLERRLPNGTFAQLAGAVTPASNGAFSKAVAVSKPTTFRATTGDRTSRLVRVPVKPRIAIASHRINSHKFRITVSAAPAQPGALVALQRFSNFSWSKLATATLSKRSTTTFVRTFKKRARIRVKELKAVRGYTPGTSAVLRVRP